MERVLREALPEGKFSGVSARRSKHMSSVKGGGNKTTERRFRAVLARGGVRGWRLSAQDIDGKPDFYFDVERVAVFVDGCFWHGCPVCGHVPSTNRPYWQIKLRRNQERDARTASTLAEQGVAVLRFWEHELQQTPGECLARLCRLLVERQW